MRLKRKESDLKQIVAQAQGAKTRLKYAKLDLDNIRKKSLVQCQGVGLPAARRWILNAFFLLLYVNKLMLPVGFRRFLVWRVKEQIWTVRSRCSRRVWK